MPDRIHANHYQDPLLGYKALGKDLKIHVFLQSLVKSTTLLVRAYWIIIPLRVGIVFYAAMRFIGKV